MSTESNRVTVVVVNSNEDVCRQLGEIVTAAGFAAVTAQPDEIGRTTAAMQEFLRRHNARVVVYDVSPPYPQSWALLTDLRYAEMMSGSWRQYVVTTPDKRALDESVGTTAAIELTQGSADAETIREAVQRGVLV